MRQPSLPKQAPPPPPPPTPGQLPGDWRTPPDRPPLQMQPEPDSRMKRFCMRVMEHHAQLAAAGEYYEVEAPEVGRISGWPRRRRLFVACVFLLPLSVIMVFALLLQIYHAAPSAENALGFWTSEPVWFSLMGVALYLSLLFFRPAMPLLAYVYVLGHEMTHALVALCCFGRIKSFEFSEQGGYVDTDKDNLAIALAPYFVPLWMAVWGGGLWLVNWIYPFEVYHPWFYAGIGFWWCFHIYWTMWIIPREQPDMLENGIVLSFLITLLMNIVVLLLILRVFGLVTLHGYWVDVQRCAVAVYSLLCEVYTLLISYAA